MPLHIDYRPSSFDEVIGNAGVIESHKSIFNRESDFPHAVLYQGPSGCGKTTLARIYAKMLGCNEKDLIEINVANNRGIDTARNIQSEMRFQPFGGPVRVYIIDECFGKNTKIKSPNGNVNIQDIKIGDQIYNIEGIATVKNIFKNRVAICRVLKIKLSNGNNIFCSNDHLFLTDKGWVKAKNLLKKDYILEFDYDIMKSLNQRKDFINDKKKMSSMQKSFFNKKQKCKILFLFLFKQIKNKTGYSNLQILWKRIQCKKAREIHKTILQSKLCCKISSRITSCNRNKQIKRTWEENKQSDKKIQIRKSRDVEKIRFETFKENEERQSIFLFKKFIKGERNKKNQWYTSYLAWKSWWEWAIYNSSKNFVYCFGMGNGNGYQNRTFSIGQKWISSKLQSRFGKQRFENCYRSGWTESQIEKDYVVRHQENKKTKRVRVESIEIYKRNDNGESFSSIIGDKERDQGFVNFYDLEIDGHPSYFANDILVHNCHQSTKDFQNAMLKALEDSPSHVYFLLCTTDPQQLLPTIRNRCTTFEMSSLSIPELKRLINVVLDGEEVDDIPEDVIEEIAEVADGCPRQALVTLDKIIDLPLESMLKSVQDMRTVESSIKDLCQAILKKKSWKEVSTILKQTDLANAENVRRAILGYMSAVLINGSDNPQAALAIEFFREPTYNSGKAGLVWATYNSIVD